MRPKADPASLYMRLMAERERDLIEYTLSQTGGDLSWAAGLLGVPSDFLRQRGEEVGVSEGLLQASEPETKDQPKLRVVPRETAESTPPASPSSPAPTASAPPRKPPPGRKPPTSPDPAFLTRREVEGVLGLSTAAVLEYRKQGQLPAVWNEEIKSYLFPRDAVEEMAAKRAQKRAKVDDDVDVTMDVDEEDIGEEFD